MLHSGIDLHKRDLVVSTVDADGRALRDAQLPTSRAAVRAYFSALPGPHRAVVESTATWYWLRDLLADAGIDLRLGHSKYIKAISYAKVKTDAVDAATLAQLLRSDLIPEGHMVSAAHREERDLLRARLRLVTQHSCCRHVIEGLLAQYNVPAPAALPPLVQRRVAMLAEQRTLLAQQIKRIEHELAPRLVPTADAQRLLYIPGVGKIVAFTIRSRSCSSSTTSPASRARATLSPTAVSYRRPRTPAGRAGTSGPRTGTATSSSPQLACSHAAVRAIQYFPEIQRFYRATVRRKPKAVARALVAKELARIVYFVLKRQEPFNGTFKGKAPKPDEDAEVAAPGEPARLTGGASVGVSESPTRGAQLRRI